MDEINAQAANYKGKCRECGNLNLIPLKLRACIACEAKRLELGANETLCLQCGVIMPWQDVHSLFCFDCVQGNIKKAQSELIAIMYEKQKKLFREYKSWQEVLRIMNAMDD